MKFYQIQNTAIRLDTITAVVLEMNDDEHTRTVKVPSEFSPNGYNTRREKYTITYCMLFITANDKLYRFDLPNNDKKGAQQTYDDLMALLEGDE